MSIATPSIELRGGPAHLLALGGLCRIGRGTDRNDFVIADGRASRRHALLRADGVGRCTLSDEGSTAGTILNDRPLTVPAELRDGDRIGIGGATLIFREPERVAAVFAPTGESTVHSLDQRLASIAVFDIRDSAEVAQRHDGDHFAEVMASFFSDAGDILDAHAAWGHKLTGDGLMAVWRHDGLLVARPELARMLAALTAVGERLTQAGNDLGEPLAWGGGINCGMIPLGNLGGARSQDFMPVGEVANKAFRLESATKKLSCTLVLGRTCFDLLDPPVPTAERPARLTVPLKGYAIEETVHPLSSAAVADWNVRLSAAA